MIYKTRKGEELVRTGERTFETSEGREIKIKALQDTRFVVFGYVKKAGYGQHDDDVLVDFEIGIEEFEELSNEMKHS